MRFRNIIWAFVVHALAASAASNASKPLEIPPSQHFEGNDGPWSSFDLRVGTPEQYVRVLVSTASPESIVALSQYACSTAVFASVPPDCAVSRGNLFNQNQSSSWHDAGNYAINGNGFGLEANLGYNQSADWGLENLGLGLTGPSLTNQTVAGIYTPEPFYLGIFGLNNQPVNFSTLGNYSAPSFITTLKDQNQIPSLSWSYTAGAMYRLKTVYGQLIFSGYDTSRFQENSVSFTMAGDITRDLVVSLQSISYSGQTSSTLLSNAIDIFIDSTDPNLWLPDDVVDAFEQAFGLTVDSATGLYLVNDTHRDQLIQTNAQVSFRLSDVSSGGDTVTIVLPYQAFDLTAGYPLVNSTGTNSTAHYFPLKRAANSGQYTLGRTFLQEAYLSADYERKVFNVSACVWNEGAQENIVMIPSADSGSGSGGSGGSGSSGGGSGGGSKLSGGAIAGIVIGALVGALLIAAALAYCILRKRREWMSVGFRNSTRPPEPDEAVLKGPVFNSGTQSSGTHSSPFSAADISAPRSTPGSSQPGGGVGTMDSSPAHPDTILEGVGGAGAFAGAGAVAGAAAADAAHQPTVELDGQEQLRPVAQNPGVYELPGSTALDGPGREVEPAHGRASSTVGSLPASEANSASPPSPFVSTMGTAWGAGERPEADPVSPSTPTRQSLGTRPF